MRNFHQFFHPLSVLAGLTFVAACGDDEKAPTTADTAAETSVGQDTASGVDTTGTDSTTPPEDTMMSNDTAEAADTAADTAADDVSATPDDTTASTGGRCVGSGVCAGLTLQQCEVASYACTPETTTSCRTPACHEASNKDACGMMMPACRWDDDLRSCKYAAEVSCESITDPDACTNTGGCILDQSFGGCGGTNWDCATMAQQAVDGAEAGCLRLAASPLGCTWEP